MSRPSRIYMAMVNVIPISEIVKIYDIVLGTLGLSILCNL
jgi:hypothetical protein